MSRSRSSRTGRRVLAGLGAAAIGSGALVLPAAPVYAADARATVVSVTAVGGPGTYLTPSGQLYAKAGQDVTVRMVTSSATNCVDVNISTTQQKFTSVTVASTTATGDKVWNVAMPKVGAVDGVVTVNNVSASVGGTASGCTGQQDNLQTTGVSYVADNTGPTVSGTLAPAPNAAGWNKADVGITWAATDNGSGIRSGPTPATDSQTLNTAGVTKTSTATDNLGNVGTGSVVVKLDKTAPTFSATRSPVANGNGWNNTNVTASFTCDDALSGIKSCTGGGSVTVTTEGKDQVIPGAAVDNADNENKGGVTVSIDKTSPSLSGAPVGAPTGTDASGAKWYDSDVAIAWTASDPKGANGTEGSGLAGTAPANGTVTGEGKDLFTSASVKDLADNTTNADSARVNIDRKAPSTDATAPTGWTNTDQTVTLSAKDPLSGVKATHYKLDGGEPQAGTSVAISGDGVHTLEYWSVDNAGNEEIHKNVQVKIDGTSPKISHALTPEPNGNGWNSGAVTVKFVCTDATSGIASCTSDQVVSDEGKDQVVTGTATDNAGNTATDPASVSIDKTPPTVTASADRGPNTAGWYSDDVTVSFKADDALSGIASAPIAKKLGEGANQEASGTATDAAGLTATDKITGINVDKTLPTLSGAPTVPPTGSNGWYKGDVTVAWTASDALSGLASAAPANSTITGEGEDKVASASVTDKAGNTTSANSSPAVKIDRTAPTTSAEVPAALDSGWYAGPVALTLNAVDSLSGVGTTYYAIGTGVAQVYDATAKPTLGKGTNVVTFWSVDKAGNTEDKTAPGHSITIKVDDVKPTISGDRNPAANGFGWNNAPVAVKFTCIDAESGIAGCVGDTTVSEQTTVDGVMVNGSAVDNAGNSAQATPVGPIKVDLTQPTVTGTPTTPDNAAGWYRGDVAIKWEGQDGLSGIDPASVPANSTITGQGAGLKAAAVTVKDKAGNASDATQSSAVNIDRTAPTITGTRAPAANTLGWNNGPVTASFACSDALSGIAECPAPMVLDQDGTGATGTGQSASGTATDKADNTASATVGGIKIDSKAPKSDSDLVCSAKNNYCKGTSATVNITATDPAPAAGVVTSGPKEIKFQVNGGLVTTTPGSTAQATVTLSGSGTAIIDFWAVDNAGNAETPNKVEVKYDTIAPTVTHSQPGNAGGWSNTDATVRFRALDDTDGSGIDRALTFCGPTPAAGEGTVTADPTNAKAAFCDTTQATETAGQLLKATADDLAGNTGTDSTTVKVDKTKPTLTTAVSGTAGSNGWYKSAVTVTSTCADPAAANGAAGSGIATCPAAEVIGNGSNQSVTLTAEDKADNKASTTAGPFNVDTDGPTVTLTGAKDGGVYTQGSVPAGSCTATDSGSGLDGTCSFSATGGNAGGVGTFTYTATAKDLAGNVTTVTGTYKVVYNVPQGTAFWLQPINDTAHELNATTSVFKAGSTIPAKFRLMANGKAFQTSTAPVWLAPVKGSATTAPVDEAMYAEIADTTSTYKWSITDSHYQYNWASPKNGAGFYWRIGVRLDDGTTQTVNIGLR